MIEWWQSLQPATTTLMIHPSVDPSTKPHVASLCRRGAEIAIEGRKRSVSHVGVCVQANVKKKEMEGSEEPNPKHLCSLPSFS